MREHVLCCLLASVILTAASASGQESCLPEMTGNCGLTPSDVFDDGQPSIWEQERLTGDWGGIRTDLKDQGVDLYASATQFYQGVASGGQQERFRYGGKLDYYMNVEGGKLGLNPGLFASVHAETRFGTSVNNIDGQLAPSNIAMNFPTSDGSVTALTGLTITQALSENFAVFGGKINTLDMYPIRYNGGAGLGGFMNTSLVFNPIGARTVPYSAVGAGFAILKDMEPVFSFTVFDPQERATDDLNNLFQTGVLLVPDFVFRTKYYGLPGIYNFGGTYSSKQYTSVDPAAYLSNIPGLVAGVFPKETGSWSVYSNFYQALWVDGRDEKRSWGLFGQFGVSDGNPNPIHYVANGGIGGCSPIHGRPLDTYGVGVFYLGMSRQFKQLAQPFSPQQDEYGAEMFYNYAVTPWCRLTGDLQVSNPSTIAVDTTILAGMRLQVLF